MCGVCVPLAPEVRGICSRARCDGGMVVVVSVGGMPHCVLCPGPAPLRPIQPPPPPRAPSLSSPLRNHTMVCHHTPIPYPFSSLSRLNHPLPRLALLSSTPLPSLFPPPLPLSLPSPSPLLSPTSLSPPHLSLSLSSTSALPSPPLPPRLSPRLPPLPSAFRRAAAAAAAAVTSESVGGVPGAVMLRNVLSRDECRRMVTVCVCVCVCACVCGMCVCVRERERKRACVRCACVRAC